MRRMNMEKTEKINFLFVCLGLPCVWHSSLFNGKHKRFSFFLFFFSIPSQKWIQYRIFTESREANDKRMRQRPAELCEQIRFRTKINGRRLDFSLAVRMLCVPQIHTNTQIRAGRKI